MEFKRASLSSGEMFYIISFSNRDFTLLCTRHENISAAQTKLGVTLNGLRRYCRSTAVSCYFLTEQNTKEPHIFLMYKLVSVTKREFW